MGLVLLMVMYVCTFPMNYKGLEMENLWATGVCTLHMVVTCSEYDSYVIDYSSNDSFTEMQCNAMIVASCV